MALLDLLLCLWDVSFVSFFFFTEPSSVKVTVKCFRPTAECRSLGLSWPVRGGVHPLF